MTSRHQPPSLIIPAHQLLVVLYPEHCPSVQNAHPQAGVLVKLRSQSHLLPVSHPVWSEAFQSLCCIHSFFSFYWLLPRGPVGSAFPVRDPNPHSGSTECDQWTTRKVSPIPLHQHICLEIALFTLSVCPPLDLLTTCPLQDHRPVMAPVETGPLA